LSEEEQVELIWVSGSKRQRGYWRKRAYTIDNPTPAQLRVRAMFAETAYEQGYGKEGVVAIEKDGTMKQIPMSAAVIREAMKDKSFKLKVPVAVVRLALPPLARLAAIAEAGR